MRYDARHPTQRRMIFWTDGDPHAYLRQWIPTLPTRVPIPLDGWVISGEPSVSVGGAPEPCLPLNEDFDSPVRPVEPSWNTVEGDW